MVGPVLTAWTLADIDGRGHDQQPAWLPVQTPQDPQHVCGGPSQQDAAFEAAVTQLAHRRKGRFQHRARLQPSRRPDLGDFTDVAKQANVFLGIHGTRAVNGHPLMKTNLRLPRQLQGVHISGAAFGHGIYFATDWKKSYGYTGHGNACYGGGGQISGRGFFMFLGDMAMGKGMTRHRVMDSPSQTV